MLPVFGGISGSIRTTWSISFDLAESAAGFADDGAELAFVFGFHFEADEVDFATLFALVQAFGGFLDFLPAALNSPLAKQEMT